MTPGVAASVSDGDLSVRGVAPDLLAEVFRHSPEAVFIGMPDGRILYANPAACALFDVSEDELCRLGRQGISNEEDPAWRAALEERAWDGQVRALLPMFRADGTALLAEVTSAIFARPGDGELTSCVIVRDVTERVRMERRLVAYDEIAEALLARTEGPEVLALVARHARSIFDATDTAVITPAESGIGVVVVAADGPGVSGRLGRSFPPGTLAETVMASRQATVVEDLSTVATTEAGRNLNLGPAMVLPIASGHLVFGALLVGARPDRHPYGPADLAAASQFAQRAALVLSLGQTRAKLEQQLQHALQSRVIIEQAKGFIAATSHIDTEEAFRRLRRYARNHSTDIHQVAADVVNLGLAV